MELADYDFRLPVELIAQEPLPQREGSRMLHISGAAGRFSDALFSDLPSILRPTDLVVLNNTRVFPARLIGRSETGARIEVFLIEEKESRVWRALAKPARRLRPGKRIDFDSKLAAYVIEKSEDGSVLVRFESEGDVDSIVEEIGRTPLPPYIHRSDATSDPDRERYQTVFASSRGAIAAPTAGLHFTREILTQIVDRGVAVAEITLHVGYGTFEPVRVEQISGHRVAPERFSIGPEAAESLEKARREKRRIVAIGTTTTRTLEYMMQRYGKFRGASGRADLTILPGHDFRAVGAMLTNFHLPKSSLLILVATFGGHQLIMNAYRHAVMSRYRFYSYGDCMLVE